MPDRIRLSRAKGFRLPPEAVNVARPTRWGNPYSFCKWGNDWTCNGRRFRTKQEAQAEAVRQFGRMASHWTEGQRAEARKALRGRDLACWCELGTPCHADVLLRIANEEGSGHG